MQRIIFLPTYLPYFFKYFTFKNFTNINVYKGRVQNNMLKAMETDNDVHLKLFNYTFV